MHCDEKDLKRIGERLLKKAINEHPFGVAFLPFFIGSRQLLNTSTTKLIQQFFDEAQRELTEEVLKTIVKGSEEIVTAQKSNVGFCSLAIGPAIHHAHFRAAAELCMNILKKENLLCVDDVSAEASNIVERYASVAPSQNNKLRE